jgi:hypothetical protein
MRQQPSDASEQSVEMALKGLESAAQPEQGLPAWAGMPGDGVMRDREVGVDTPACCPRQLRPGVRRVRRKLGRIWVTIVYDGIDTFQQPTRGERWQR